MGKNKNNKLSPKASQQSSKSLLIEQQSFSGPIPPPAILEQYAKILPNAPERIMAMAEKQQAHGHKIT